MVGIREQRSREGFLKELPPALSFDRKKEGVAPVTSVCRDSGVLRRVLPLFKIQVEQTC